MQDPVIKYSAQALPGISYWIAGHTRNDEELTVKLPLAVSLLL